MNKFFINFILILTTCISTPFFADANDEGHRLVSLTPSITKTIADLGMSKYMVGLTSYCKIPIDASQAEIIGTSVSPNIEAIIAQKPTLVIGDVEFNREPILKKLESVGAQVVRVGPHHSLESITETMRTLGDELGVPEKANDIIKKCEKRITDIQTRIKDHKPVPVFVEIWPKPLKTISGQDFVNDIISMAAGDNIFANHSISYPTVSMESVIARKPEKIIILTHSLVDEDRIKQYQQFPDLKNCPIKQFDSTEITQPNLINFVDGVELIANWLHGLSDEKK